tara:strand:- start:1137 stop:1949 length:813 start_codon:yes stop_codon:yes gene_type:complete
MINKININKYNVTLQTDLHYKAIEINYTGKLNIKKLLPNNYLLKKGVGRIIILKFNQNRELFKDLFSYIGVCYISSATLIDENYNKHQLYVNVKYLTTWDNMKGRIKQDGTKISKTWEGLSDNYEKLNGSIRNDGYEKIIYIDDGTNTKTKIQQKIMTYPNTYKKDRNIRILGNQYTNGAKYKEKGKNTPYKGSYHIYLDTLKVMTGEMPQESSKQLVKLTKKKNNKLFGHSTTCGPGKVMNVNGMCVDMTIPTVIKNDNKKIKKESGSY